MDRRSIRLKNLELHHCPPSRPLGHDLVTLAVARKEIPDLPEIPKGKHIDGPPRIARCADCGLYGRGHNKVFGTYTISHGGTTSWRCYGCINKRREAKLVARVIESRAMRQEKSERRKLKAREKWGREARKRYRWDTLNYPHIVGHKRKKAKKTLKARLGND